MTISPDHGRLTNYIIVLFFIALLFGCVHDKQRLMQRGIESFENKDYSVARRQFAKALSLDTTDAEAHYYLGRTLMELHDLDAAGEQFSLSVKYDPDLSKSFTSLGLIAILKEDYDNAITFLRNALLFDPRDITALNNLGYIFVKREDYAEAIKYYTQANELDPVDSVSNLNLGELYRKVLLNGPRASTYYLRYLASQTAESATALEIRAWLQKQGELQPNEDEREPKRLFLTHDDTFEESTDVQPSSPPVPSQSPDEDLKISNSEKIKDALNKGNDNFQQALDLLLKESEQSPADGRIHGRLGIVYFRLGQVRLALKELKIAKSLGIQDPEVIDLLEQIYLLRGDLAW